jgi:CheY-like chemotaxis protein
MSKILLIEDNEGDILLTSVILKDLDPGIKIDVARDGEEAFQMLDMIRIKRNGSRPSLILLDVNLPKRNGFEILSYIKNTEFLKDIPVVMLTTSSFSKDRLKAIENNADDFLTKSSELLEFQSTINGVYSAWIINNQEGAVIKNATE